MELQSKEIKVKLIHELQPDGRGYYAADYNPEDLRELCLALISDPDLRKLALHATSYILASHTDPEETLGELRENARKIRQEYLTNKTS